MTRRSVFSRSGAAWLAAVACCALTACVTGGSDASAPGAAHFTTLLYNAKWYRTFDSTSTIGEEGTLVFAWAFEDTLQRPDSFYVGIDTLWMLPQNVNGDTTVSGDWDLQICLDGGFCQGGLANDVHGGNAPIPFGGELDTFATEHHVQFFPALKPNVAYGVSPDSAIFGGMLFAQSRTGKSRPDTVLVYGSWKIPWDDAYAPPSRPVNGYLPKRGDFTIVGGKIRYTGPE